VAKDKAKLVKALRAGEGSTGPFQSYVEILIFAASIGMKNKNYMPFLEFSVKNPDPIPWEHFLSRNHNQIVDLLAIIHTKMPRVLENSDEYERTRVEIFEGYANGGLILIQQYLNGTDDVLGQLQLLISQEKKLVKKKDELLDLSFLSD
jgi:dnd system-associated protein 4